MKAFDRQVRPVRGGALGLAVALAAGIGLAAAAAADDQAPAAQAAEAAPPAIDITGFVDTYYGYNSNKPTGDAPLRNFDTRHNAFSVSLLELAFEQKPTSDHPFGFRADLNFGSSTKLIHAFEPADADVFQHFQQAYVSYLAPAGKGLQFDVGKFVTPVGAEVIESKDNWNYSRSLLFALAIPYYHVGVRATYSPSDKATFAGYLVNGWNNQVENNDGKTFLFQAILKPSAKLTLIQNVAAGPEQAGADDSRLLSDTVLILAPTAKLSLMANYDYGRDKVAGTTVNWSGIAVSARLQATERWALSPRFEWLDDDDGFMTATSQSLKEFTLTSEQKLSGGLLSRIEYRRDFSDKTFFTKEGRSVKDQNTFTVGLVYAFAGKL